MMLFNHRHSAIPFFSILFACVVPSACAMDATPGAAAGSSGASAVTAQASDLRLLAATFGADNFGGLGNCAQYAPIDGLPVVFSAPIRVASVSAADFQVVRADGSTVTPLCATLAPAVDADERRTVLLQGYFGSATNDDPVSVRIVGSIPAADGSGDFQGASVFVVPYGVGQHLVYARSQSISGNVGGADQCPVAVGGYPTTQVIQLAFGSNAGNSFSTSTDYLARFSVTLADGSIAHPVAFGDTTVDNYLELCLTEGPAAVSVTIAPETVTDASGQYNEVELSSAIEP